MIFSFLYFCTQGRYNRAIFVQAVLYLIDLWQDRNGEVRKTADACLDVVMDMSEQWAGKIRSMKFESHNQDWLEIVGHPKSGSVNFKDAIRRSSAGADGRIREEIDFSDGDVDFLEGNGRGLGEHRYKRTIFGNWNRSLSLKLFD